MQAYYYNDAHLKEWVDEIVEKLLTVCLLTGQEADLEFARGQQAVKKIVQVLHELSDLPPEALYEGLEQLLEQRLPDARVTENFPMFGEVMTRMINGGIAQALDCYVGTEPESVPVSSSFNWDKAIRETQLSPEISPEQNESETEPKFRPEQLRLELEEIEPDAETDTFEVLLQPDCPQLGEPNMRFVRKSEIPTEAKILAFVLKTIYPSARIRWNVTLGKYAFLAQVNDLLIFVNNAVEVSDVIHAMTKEGWRVLTINQEDLNYRHRLERQVRSVKKISYLNSRAAQKDIFI